jgi:hypothetical protein
LKDDVEFGAFITASKSAAKDAFTGLSDDAATMRFAESSAATASSWAIMHMMLLVHHRLLGVCRYVKAGASTAENIRQAAEQYEVVEAAAIAASSNEPPHKKQRMSDGDGDGGGSAAPDASAAAASSNQHAMCMAIANNETARAVVSRGGQRARRQHCKRVHE